MVVPKRRLCHSFIALYGLTLLDSVVSWLSTKAWRLPGPCSTPPLAVATYCATTTSQIVLESGKKATLRSRSVVIADSWKISVWEWDQPATVMEHYWDSQTSQNLFASKRASTSSSSTRQSVLLDPFGLVSWPGSVVAAQEMLHYRHQIENCTVLILGAGPGVEAQAAAMLGATQVVATDIHPTTLRLLRHGARQAGLNDIIQTRVFDICSEEPLPDCDILIGADVLYNEHLAAHMGRRCLEALQKDRKILISDSQRFTDLLPELNRKLDETGAASLSWTEHQLEAFRGSGVMVNDDQTYNVTARVLTAGWKEGLATTTK